MSSVFKTMCNYYLDSEGNLTTWLSGNDVSYWSAGPGFVSRLWSEIFISWGIITQNGPATTNLLLPWCALVRRQRWTTIKPIYGHHVESLRHCWKISSYPNFSRFWVTSTIKMFPIQAVQNASRNVKPSQGEIVSHIPIMLN